MKQILLTHFGAYPRMTAQDGVKLVYQAAFGPGHLLADREKARAFLHRELEQTPARAGAMLEPIGGGYARLHLAQAKAAGLEEEVLFQRFLSASRGPAPGMAAFEEHLRLLEELAARGLTPFSARELADYLTQYRAAGCPMVSHSDTYRQAYHPAYRVVNL